MRPTQSGLAINATKSGITSVPLWTVKYVALHLLGGDIGNLSRRRDEFRPSSKPLAGYRELVKFIDELNGEWVRAGQRMSPRVVCDLLAFSGPQLTAFSLHSICLLWASR